MGHARDFVVFKRFVETNIATYVTDQSAVIFFDRLFNDFPIAHGGFQCLLKALDTGEPVHTTTDGSKLDEGAASAGWFFWLINLNNDDHSDVEDDPVDVRVCLFAGTILVDGRLESNTSFRAEAMGKLTVSILLHCLYAFIDR